MDAPSAGAPVAVVAPVPVVAVVEVVFGPDVAVSEGLLSALVVPEACVVEVSAGLDPPNPENKLLEGAEAGVDEGAADDVFPPSEKRDF